LTFFAHGGHDAYKFVNPEFSAAFSSGEMTVCGMSKGVSVVWLGGEANETNSQEGDERWVSWINMDL
jgi:hypothetical protein